MQENTFNKMIKNTESAWDEEFSFEHTSLAAKVFSDICCNGCSCQSPKDHKLESSCVCGNTSCNC